MPAWKVSGYLTLSGHSYRGEGADAVCLVLSGRSGRLLTVPTAVADELRKQHVPADDAGVLDILRSAEIVVGAEEDELCTLIERNVRSSEHRADLSFTILPTSYCNMGCDYCGQQHQTGAFAPAVERAVIERVVYAIGRPETRSVRVYWFGAEPMAAYPSILRASDAFVRAAEEHGIAYGATLVTNGTLLTIGRLLELHRRAVVDFVEVTLDGPPAVHDRRRPLRNGGSSFDAITAVLREAIDHALLGRVHLRIRTNVDIRNADTIDEYLRTMKTLGFDHGNLDFELHCVHRWSNDVSAIVIEKEAFAARKAGWMRAMLDSGLPFSAVPTGARPVVCGAVDRGAEILNADGAVFACTEHPLIPVHAKEDVVGSVFDPPQAERLPGSFAAFYERVAAEEVPCHRCELFGICGGACPKHWAEGNVPCPDFKYNMQARLDIAAAMNGLHVLER
jgi:uncharacterized protein